MAVGGRDRHQSRRKKGGPSSEPRGPPGARAREEVEEAAKETEEDQPVREKEELQGAVSHTPRACAARVSGRRKYVTSCFRCRQEGK